MHTKKTGMHLLILSSIFLVLALSSCQDIATFLTDLDDTVKLANDRYLEVDNTFPEQNDNNLSPRIEILVTLDRNVDPEDIRSYLQIEQRDAAGDINVFGDGLNDKAGETIDLDFNETDKTLTIFAYPFLNGGEKIIVSLLPGAPALDGSVLRDQYSWSFYTVNMPVGTIDIADGNDVSSDVVEGFTNDPTPTVTVYYSNAGDYYLDENESAVDNITTGSTSWEQNEGKSGDDVLDPNDGLPDDFSFNWSGDPAGSKTIYAIFKDPISDTLSFKVSDTVFFDEDPPASPSAGSNITTYRNTSITRTASYSEPEPPVGSGFQNIEWYSPNGAQFGSKYSDTTTIYGPAGTTVTDMQARFTVTDRAGNSATSPYITIDWDDQPPNRPNIATRSASPPPPDLNYTWSSGGGFRSGESSGGFSSRFGYVQYGYKGYPTPSYGAWSSASSATSRTGSGPTNVAHYYVAMQVREYDELGNVSSADTEGGYYVHVNPVHGSTKLYLSYIKKYATLDWPIAPSILRHSYRVYIKKPGETVFTAYSTGSATDYQITVPSEGLYEWYYTATYLKSTVTSPTFRFTAKWL